MALDLTNNNPAVRAMAAGIPDRTILIGVDLGKLEAHSAIVVLERFEEMPTNHVDVLRGVGPRKRYIVRHAERLLLDTPYTEVVLRVKRVAEQLATRGRCVVVLDETGVGVPVMDIMRKASMDCWLNPIKISAGQQATPKSVPREELLTRMKMMVERHELEIATGCLHGAQLKRELTHLQLTGAAGGRRRRGVGGEERDDLAFALALACWKAWLR